jgi:hypothetical protein
MKNEKMGNEKLEREKPLAVINTKVVTPAKVGVTTFGRISG